MKNIKQYYKELGKIVYAVAITDGVITPAEREILHHFVVKNLANYELGIDSSGMNKAFYVDFEFEDSAEKHLDTATAIKTYVAFVHANYENGDEPLVQHSLDLLGKVAEAYSREKERDLVKDIKQEINEVHKIS